jgi:hypothetical protein
VPTLGHPAGQFAHFSNGFGEVQPSVVDLGGDPTGLLRHVAWSSWGGPRATGTGISTYVAPGQHTYQGTFQTATVVAFDLGTCAGQFMYQAVEWYFPQHGGSFNPSKYIDICSGTFVRG